MSAELDRLFTSTINVPPLVAQMKRPAFFVVFIVLHVFIFLNIARLSRDMIYGDFSATRLSPAPIYAPVRVPKNDFTAKYAAPNRLSADFAQIYFPVRGGSLGDAYNRATTLDPWWRPSRYAPLIHFLCSMTLCRLKYGYASFLNEFIQIVLFVLTLYLALKSLGISAYFWPCLLFVDCSLFLTPAGLTWFERGQFSLYVGISYLLVSLGLFKRNMLLIVLGALSAFVKWTAFPFLAVVLSVFILKPGSSREERLFSMQAAAAICMVIALLSVLFIEESRLFVRGLLEQELYLPPNQLSLASYLPRFFVKCLPLLLILVGYIDARRHRKDPTDLAPYLAGTAIILLLYPTLAFNYNVVTLLGLIPLMVYWAMRSKRPGEFARKTIFCLFLTFVIVASFGVELKRYWLLIIIYLATSSVLILIPLVLPRRTEGLLREARAAILLEGDLIR
jgi:hypothetical protein